MARRRTSLPKIAGLSGSRANPVRSGLLIFGGNGLTFALANFPEKLLQADFGLDPEKLK